MGHADLPVAAAPLLGGVEHAAVATHVPEDAGAGGLGAAALDPRDPGHGPAAPQLSALCWAERCEGRWEGDCTHPIARLVLHALRLVPVLDHVVNNTMMGLMGAQ